MVAVHPDGRHQRPLPSRVWAAPVQTGKDWMLLDASAETPTSLPVQVVVAVFAGQDHAGAGLAGAGRVGQQRAVAPAAAAVLGVAGEVAILHVVDPAVAVVVDAVADLGAAVALLALASEARVEMTGSTSDGALAISSVAAHELAADAIVAGSSLRSLSTYGAGNRKVHVPSVDATSSRACTSGSHSSAARIAHSVSNSRFVSPPSCAPGTRPADVWS
jgi:hypothetical protein